MDRTLLDTDTLSEIFKGKNTIVLSNAAAYVAVCGHLSFSALSRFEIVRGLRYRNAAANLQRFENVCHDSQIFAVSDSILDRAADLWAYGRQHGHFADDADLIIAATALEAGLTVVTGNTDHFGWMPGLAVDDWRTN